MFQNPHSSRASAEPLSFAVHTLPDLADPRVVDAPPSGRGKLLAIVVACSLPVLLAYLIFFFFKPSGQVGFGELIHPARPMPEATLTDLQGQAVALSSLKNQWLLVSVGPSACDEACAKHLFIQRQLREMLNKDKDRVDRLWLVQDGGAVPEQLTQLLQGAQVLRVAPDLQAQWLGDAPEQAAAHLYLIDPQGHAMLRMPADQDSKQAHAALRVLQKLLAASAAWDQPGR